MSRVHDGVKSFQSDIFPSMNDHFAGLRDGQAPETLFITCSDSRVDPCLLTQSKPGQIFVIQNAGNIVPKPGSGELGVEATIQYAVDVLKVKQIVVCGHAHCGAVSALLNLESVESLPVIRDWVLTSKAILDDLPEGEDRVERAICANVSLQLEHLQEFECVANAIKSGQLSLHGWVYHFDTGEVTYVSEPDDVV